MSLHERVANASLEVDEELCGLSDAALRRTGRLREVLYVYPDDPWARQRLAVAQCDAARAESFIEAARQRVMAAGGPVDRVVADLRALAVTARDASRRL